MLTILGFKKKKGRPRMIQMLELADKELKNNIFMLKKTEDGLNG